MKKEQFMVAGMHCASCALTVERALKKVPGVKKAEVNFATEKAAIEFEDNVSLELLKNAVFETGYKLESHNEHPMPGKIPTGDEHDHHKLLKEAEIRLLRKKFAFGAVFSVFVILLSLPDYFQSIGKLMSDSLLGLHKKIGYSFLSSLSIVPSSTL